MTIDAIIRALPPGPPYTSEVVGYGVAVQMAKVRTRNSRQSHAVYKLVQTHLIAPVDQPEVIVTEIP